MLQLEDKNFEVITELHFVYWKELGYRQYMEDLSLPSIAYKFGLKWQNRIQGILNTTIKENMAFYFI